MGYSGGEVDQGIVWLITFTGVVAAVAIAYSLITRTAHSIKSLRAAKRDASTKTSPAASELASTETKHSKLEYPSELEPLKISAKTRQELLVHMRQQYATSKVDVVKPKPSSFKMTTYTYTKRSHIMTQTERKFYLQLYYMFKGQYFVFPQIHLADLLDYRHTGQSYRGAWASIKDYSVDYVICSPSLQVLSAIELDDRSHSRPDRQARDQAVNQICEKAALPLVRIAVDDMHNDRYVKQAVQGSINY